MATDLAMESDLELAFLALRERIGRSLSTLLTVWLVAGLALMVPILHWILVPALIVAGPVAAAVAFRTRVRLVPGARVPCPRCASTFSVESEAFGWPLSLNCSRCFARLSVTPRDRP